jgi:phytoene synthase
MKISAFALTSLLAMGATDAFITRGRVDFAIKASGNSLDTSGRAGIGASTTYLNSIAQAESKMEGRSEDEIEAELSAGKIMEGGKVIDFEAIKGPSRAEQALETAKVDITNSGEKYVPPGNGILGINDEVVSEVGHELANFASSEEVQLCATYLRSKAPKSLFEKKADSISEAPSFSEEENSKIQSILRKAYDESGEVTSAFAKTFYLGTQLLPEASREAIWAIYVWCRRTDEIVDAPRDSDEEMLQDLGSWEMRLEDLWKHGEVEDVYDLCLLDVLVKYPNLSITPFTDMIRGMLMDVPKLGQDRYDSFDELHLYCYRVAGTVGLMSLPIFGCAQGYNDQIAR